MVKQPSPKFSVSGIITKSNKKPAVGFTVKAFDQDPNGENPLGQPSRTDNHGAYQIPYDPSDFRIKGKESGGADITIRVYENEILVAETKPMRDAKKIATINVEINIPAQVAAEPSVLSPKQLVRLRTLGKEFSGDGLRTEFGNIFSEKRGNLDATLEAMGNKKGVNKEQLSRLDFINRVAEISDDHEPLVSAFRLNDNTKSLRDIALGYTRKSLTEFIRAVGLPEESNPGKEAQAPSAFEDRVYDKLFKLEPTAMVQRMVASADETPFPDKSVSGGIATFLRNQPETFNIKTTSIYEAFKKENAFEGIAPELHYSVKSVLKDLQRVVALSPVPESLPVLMASGMTSALRVSEMPESQFVQAFAKSFGAGGERVGQEVHAVASNARIRNEHALIAIKEAVQGTGIAMIDKAMITGMASAPKLGAKNMEIGPSHTLKNAGDDRLKNNNLNWDLLFGDADFCECGECTSVYSAAAYYVELLQYLRNNNLDPNNLKAGSQGIEDTPVEKLFQRRPDLGCLQLTCKNTNTLLPYIDLVNEVMENYVVYHCKLSRSGSVKIPHSAPS